MNAQAIDPRMIEALEGASSLQLYQLKAIIESMLTDPRRGLAARADLHLGQSVCFVRISVHRDRPFRHRDRRIRERDRPFR